MHVKATLNENKNLYLAILKIPEKWGRYWEFCQSEKVGTVVPVYSYHR